MSKKKLGTIIGCNTAITAAAVTIEAASGCVNAVCLVFMKNGNLPDETAK